ncbi:DUF2170 family protein [Pseudoxanthomonas sp.]|uniref:DUF2170 family protein n=1 Tax=Pseudoxanthomonas sp. TaxID=1871049 RepID=UPI0028C4CA0D|nr:DUF2170 family protein [Pseudoxanthomonas sp.]
MTAPRPALKASTLHVRNYRERMREQGLVKKDVWIRPEYAEELAAIEKSMRESERKAGIPYLPTQPIEAGWTVPAIRHAIGQTSAVRDGLLSVETIEGAEPSLHLVMHEYGDLSVFLAVGGEQILVEAYLWPVDDVMDPAAFNAHVLSTHVLLPLSTIGMQRIGGVAGYSMFGALDSHSSLANVMFEIETLAENVIHATDAYRPYLRVAQKARA